MGWEAGGCLLTPLLWMSSCGDFVMWSRCRGHRIMSIGEWSLSSRCSSSAIRQRKKRERKELREQENAGQGKGKGKDLGAAVTCRRGFAYGFPRMCNVRTASGAARSSPSIAQPRCIGPRTRVMNFICTLLIDVRVLSGAIASLEGLSVPRVYVPRFLVVGLEDAGRRLPMDER